MERQHQRRWLVLNPKRLARRPDLRAARNRSQELRDWFHFDQDNPFNYTRYRLTDGQTLSLTVKRAPDGRGRRRQVTSVIDHRADELVKIMGAPRTIKRRYAFTTHVGGVITVDVYSKPGRIAIVEWHNPPAGATDEDLPDWIRTCGVVEVTNALTSAHIAALPAFDGPEDAFLSLQDQIANAIPMIVLTGGPCSGKTSVMDILAKDKRLHVVPEVATILIGQLGIKPFGKNGHGVRFQIALRRIQLVFEALARLQARADGKAAVVMDRGVLDACAYLPHGWLSYKKYFGVTANDDGRRYKVVIQLAVPKRSVYNAHRKNNPSRRETHAQAVALGKKIREAWEGHREYLMADHPDWEAKQEFVVDRVYAYTN